jgi:D-alanyl-D-alanine carboxypeptidase
MTAALVFVQAAGAEAARKKQRAQPVDRYASIVIDYQSGVVLSERNANKSLYPASLTKMMTLYLAFDALERGDLSRYKRLSVSSKASAQAPSKLGLKPGETIRAEDAILALVTKSANDAAVVLAEGISGSEKNFVAQMNATARKLGMTRTNFVNPSGLHAAKQVSTARDMAILSQALIRDFPRHYKYFSTNTFSYAGVAYDNHNKLMKTYTGMDGIKTGYVYASGFNLAASAVQDGRRLIGIVFGGRTPKTRNQHMADLMDRGFAAARTPAIASRIQKRLQVASAQPQNLSAQPQKKPAARNTAVASLSPSAPAQQLSQIAPSFGLIGQQAAQRDGIEQGDADAGDAQAEVELSSALTHFQSRPLNVRSAQKPGGFAVQVGAFSTIEAGMDALSEAKNLLPATTLRGTDTKMVPLMTNRGMIYRARLTGFSQPSAEDVCRRIRGHCLILPMQE